MLESLGQRRISAARDALRNGRYQLLLGAGASFGAVTTKGAIPMAGQLVSILAANYPKAPIQTQGTLFRAYQRAVQVSSPEHVWRTLRDIFAGATHEAWFQSLVELPWQRIWTLNVDDTVESTYRASTRSRLRPIRTISWDDPYSESGSLDVVHLHGHVIGNEPRSLIFSFSEYAGASSRNLVWHQMLTGLMGSDPFVIVGARMLDDPDVEAILLNNPPAAKAPSFFVDPHVTDDNVWELERAGYVVVKESAQDFTNRWREKLDITGELLAALDRSNALSVPQLSRLETNRISPPPRSHDFYGGDAPLWSDVAGNLPALFDDIRICVEALERWVGGDGSREAGLFILYGERLAGLSTAVLYAAREAIKLGIAVYLFDRSSRWNVSAVLELVRGQGPTVVLVDSAVDFADDIDKTLRAAKKDGLPLLFLCADLRYNDLKLEERLGGTFAKESHVMRRGLSRRDANALVERLSQYGRLGSLELATERERVSSIAGRDIFSAMMDVEYSLGFQRRVDTEIRAIEVGWKTDLVLLLGLAAQSSRLVAVSDAAIAVGIRTDLMKSSIASDGSLSALVEVRDNLIVARQRDKVLESLLKVVGTEDGLKSVLRMVHSLAPLATRSSLQERNRIPLLMGHLMASRTLTSAFPGEDLEDFYSSLLSVFGSWNGRYWEQRAIYAKSTGRWSKAESFAARAVTIYDDPYTRTTYGTILMNRAAVLIDDGDANWENFYARAVTEYEIAYNRDSSNRVTLFAQLESTIAVLEQLAALDAGDNARLNFDRIGNDWTRVYSVLRIGLRNEENLQSVKRAEKLSERYERVARSLGGDQEPVQIPGDRFRPAKKRSGGSRSVDRGGTTGRV